MKIKLVDGSIYQVSRADITNSRLEIDFKDKTCEDIQKIFSKSENLAKIEFLTDGEEKYGDALGWTKLGAVMFVNDIKTVILTQAVDVTEQRLTVAEADALKAKTIAEDLKENGVSVKHDKILNASVSFARMSAQSLSDKEAIKIKDIYDNFENLVNIKYIAEQAGYKFIHGNSLYKTVNNNQRFQADWIPGRGTESIFIRIDEVHTGTFEDPIPAAINMEYIKGLHYIEGGQIYKMNRAGMEDGESIILQFFPSELTGQYFEIVDIRHTI